MNPLQCSLLVLLLAGLSGCSGAAPGLQAGDDAGLLEQPDAGAINKAAQCATTFGNGLTNGFGRFDGTVLAVVKPTDTQCTEVNGTHLVIEVLSSGAVYRIVVNVLSDGRNGTDTRMKLSEVPHPLLGGPWSEGWHPGAALDYPGDLGAHVDGFTPHVMSELIELVAARINIGDRISFFATSQNKPSSAHLVHRNPATPAPDDGAIVIGPDSADPLYLLFCWDGITF